jgi:hypothetical protein
MSQPYRICHNCGASLTPDQSYCPRCGAPCVAPIVQQPVPPPPSQTQASYPPQSQGYAPPSAPSPYSHASYGQQMPGTSRSEQVDSSFQPPSSQRGRGISPFFLIGMVVVILLLFVGVGSLFYNLGQHNGSKPGTTPTPGITSRPTPTSGTRPTPTPTPSITPTATAFQAPAPGKTGMLLSMHYASSNAIAQTNVSKLYGLSSTSLKEIRQSVFAPPEAMHKKTYCRG